MRLNLPIFMVTIFLTIIVFAIIIFLLSIGIIFSNKNLRGSCGESCDCTITKKIKCQFSNMNSISHINN